MFEKTRFTRSIHKSHLLGNFDDYEYGYEYEFSFKISNNLFFNGILNIYLWETRLNIELKTVFSLYFSHCFCV